MATATPTSLKVFELSLTPLSFISAWIEAITSSAVDDGSINSETSAIDSKAARYAQQHPVQDHLTYSHRRPEVLRKYQFHPVNQNRIMP